MEMMLKQVKIQLFLKKHELIDVDEQWAPQS